MKTFKFIILFLTMSMIVSCGKDEIGITPKVIDEETEQEEEEFMNDGDYPFRQHLLWLSFKDTSGNDLLKGSEFIWNSEFGMRDTVKPESYTLDIVFENGIPNPWKPAAAPLINGIPAYILDVRYPRLYLAEGWLSPPKDSADSDYIHLWFDTHSYRDSEFPEKITLRLTCPYLFNDNEPHDIVTYWEPYEVLGASCLRVEFEGKEYKMSDINSETKAVATIILDK